ncbi:MAG: lipoyl(octanoyl) transferase LipB [Myxococcota bacterium]
MGEASELQVRELGCVPYDEALALQERVVAERRAGHCPDTLLLLEHPPVVTQGRSAKPSNLRWTPEEFAQKGVALHEVARGGDVTYHAPGQLVGYPIVDLAARDARDVHAWLRRLEENLGRALTGLGVAWCRVPGWTGVFVETPALARARKIASIGIGVRGWVTYHGFALNVDIDLGGFDCIVPCGLEAVDMTSVAAELGTSGADCATRTRVAVRAAFEADLGASGAADEDPRSGSAQG